MDVLAAVAGMVGGVILGIALTFVAHGATGNPYAKWLGRRCWVRPIRGGKWEPHVIVAVSWRGAICVRDAGSMDRDGYWIKKQNVPFRVTFRRPEGGRR